MKAAQVARLVFKTALAVVVALSVSPRNAQARAPDPATQGADLYAWVQGNNLVVLATYIPFSDPAAPPTLSALADDVLYEIHLARGPSSLAPVLSYQFEFHTAPAPTVDPANLGAPLGGGKEVLPQLAGARQTYTVTQVSAAGSVVLAQDVPVAPPNLGPRTNAVVYQVPAGKTYEQHFVTGAASVIRPLGPGGAEGRVFVGPRDDPTVMDRGAFNDLLTLRTLVGGTPRDSTAGLNVHTLALEIPLGVANGGTPVAPGTSDAQTVGIWSTASRRKISIQRRAGPPTLAGPWVQVSRMGFPMLAPLMVGVQSQDTYHQSPPANDLANLGGYLLNPVLVRDAEAMGFYSQGGPLAGCGDINQLKSNRMDILELISLNGFQGHHVTALGDVLRVDLGTASGFPNGHKVNPGTNQGDDVLDVMLGLLLCRLAAVVPDGVSANDATFGLDFPYLATPWAGSN